MIIAARSEFEPVASRTTGTPPAGDTSTAGSSSLPSNELRGRREQGRGCRLEARPPKGGRSRVCGGAGAEPPSTAPPGAVSFLDTQELSRQPEETCALAAPMLAWLREVGEETKADRTRRAQKLTARRVQICSAMRRYRYGEASIRWKAKWYDDRARGHRERIERVEACQADIIHVSCSACGVGRELAAGCRAWMLCVRCRGAVSAALRARFLAARRLVVEQAMERNLFRPVRRGGRYGERFLTLTVPHESRSIAGRIGLAFAAWTRFLKLFNAHLRAHVIRSVEWFRVFEWTPGEDGLGHPHFHVWLFSPFIDVDLIREWWALALAAEGCAATRVIVDIKAITDPRTAAAELIKYMLKDITSSGEKIPPAVFARVYEALAGRRMRQASEGFMGLAKGVLPCCECGATLPRTVRIERRSKPTKAKP
jgi:hypothetical protein